MKELNDEIFNELPIAEYYKAHILDVLSAIKTTQ